MLKETEQSELINTLDKQRSIQEIEIQTRQKAAVLIPIMRIASQWEVLFIRRTERQGDQHSGQVAFPGGKFEPNDADIEFTAIREANEEIGLDTQKLDLLGSLSPYHTVTNYKIYPFVGIIPWPVKLTRQKSEVARIFTIPLNWLKNSQNYRLKKQKFTSDFGMRPESVVHYNQYSGELLWGATAQITLALLKAIDNRQFCLS